MKLFLVAALSASFIHSEPYNRSDFPHWRDLDKDCQNSREEAIIDQAVIAPSNPCKPKTIIIDLYTNLFLHSSSADADHIVPLKEVWRSQIVSLTPEQRLDIANDPLNIVMTHYSLNRSKADKPPYLWLPPKKQCQYIKSFTSVKQRYKLYISPVTKLMLWQCEITNPEINPSSN